MLCRQARDAAASRWTEDSKAAEIRLVEAKQAAARRQAEAEAEAKAEFDRVIAAVRQTDVMVRLQEELKVAQAEALAAQEVAQAAEAKAAGVERLIKDIEAEASEAPGRRCTDEVAAARRRCTQEMEAAARCWNENVVAAANCWNEGVVAAATTSASETLQQDSRGGLLVPTIPNVWV